jgi:hypothetical protein
MTHRGNPLIAAISPFGNEGRPEEPAAGPARLRGHNGAI